MKSIGMKKYVLAGALAVMMVVASVVTGVNTFAYSEAPVDIEFGKEYSGVIKTTEYSYRYNFSIDKAQGFDVVLNNEPINGGKTMPVVRIFNEREEELVHYMFEDAYNSASFALTAGKYYVVVDGYMGASGEGATFKLKLTAKELPKTSVKKLINKKSKQLKVKYKTDKTVTGYQIQAATNKKFTKNKKTVTVTDYKTASATLKKLKKRKKYYVRVRTYTEAPDKEKCFGEWSKVKTVKTK